MPVVIGLSIAAWLICGYFSFRLFRYRWRIPLLDSEIHGHNVSCPFAFRADWVDSGTGVMVATHGF